MNFDFNKEETSSTRFYKKLGFWASSKFIKNWPYIYYSFLSNCREGVKLQIVGKQRLRLSNYYKRMTKK